ncbi:MAG: hypothetical protein KBT47_01410 [Armatimonadetes bacterium]|nr:hypothetical protein [Candidatus Hippobium faecium]
MNDDNKINLDQELGDSFLNLEDLNFNNLKDHDDNSEQTEHKNSNSQNTETDLLKELNELANEATKKMEKREAERKKAEEDRVKTKEQQKYIIIGLILAVLICFVFAFSSCGKKPKHKNTPSNRTKTHNNFSSSNTMPDFNTSNTSSSSAAGPVSMPQGSGFETNPM